MENKYIMIEELAKSEEFMKSLSEAITPEDVKSVFAEYGFDMTLEETAAMIELAKAGAENELSEESLDAVSGGIIVTLGGWLLFSAGMYAAGTIGKMLLK